MEVILLKDMPNLGEMHDTVTVKPGYARNFLIPKRIAVVANSTNSNKVSELRRQTERKLEKELADFKAIVAKLDATKIKIGAKVGTTEKIFGSVTNVQIADAIKKAIGADIDRRKISIEDEIKTLGEYTAHIKLHPKVSHDLTFEVVGE